MYFLRESTVILRGFMGSKTEPQVCEQVASSVCAVAMALLVITRIARLLRERAGVY